LKRKRLPKKLKMLPKRSVKKLVVGQLQTNCYLILDEKKGEAVIIDPGDDADYLIRVISDLETKPVKIITTHGHYDHLLAVAELKLAYQIPFLIHQEDQFLLSRAAASASRFSGLKASLVPKIDRYLKEGDCLRIGNCRLEIIHTPGHTPGSISLYSNELGAVFVGDLIFAGGGVGRTDFAYSNQRDLEKSIQKLFKLPKKTIVYSGHGEETTIQEIMDVLEKV